MSSYAAYLLLYLGALCCASLVATDLQAADLQGSPVNATAQPTAGAQR